MNQHGANQELARRIERVRERIAAAARRAGREPAGVTLVAVSKMQPAETVAAAYAAGLRLFGENRVEEAGPKAGAVARLLAPAPPPVWHMVGHLQSRKAADVLPWASMVHSVDSAKLAGRLSRFVTENDTDDSEKAPYVMLSGSTAQNSVRPNASEASPTQAERDSSSHTALLRMTSALLPILLEVNVAGEESKYGFAPAELPAAVEVIAALPGLRIAGLMTMAPIVPDPELARPVFAGLRDLRNDLARRYPALNLEHLSMGMTDDFEVAIEEGATLVRIGRAIFGE